MIIGMDFGTTNSGMAVYDGQQVQLLNIDPTNTNPKVARTALYLTNDQNVYIGREAVDHYFEHNLGRPVKMERVWVGEIEVTVADMTWIQDVYIWVDALSPGRLFLSVKTSLADADYLGTVIDPYFYTLEDLIALYLSITRARAEKLLDQELRRVVLGRPVKFSNDPKKDALAQQRLIEAALRAGYEEIYFQYEPVAAALHYEQSITQEENVLIFDFGGGTLDITIIRLGGPNRREVLATGGVPIAGDIFDQRLIRGKLPKHFGEGTIYGGADKPLTMPSWIHNTFSDWQMILQLQTPKNVQLLQNIARTARNPKGINALISLVSSNYGLQMFDTVERSKRRLSRRNSTIIPLSGPGLNIREPVTRTEFESLINREFRIIEQEVTSTLEASGLRAGQIDAVIRTGGSSQIPLFEAMLKEKFGPDKVRISNVFSSVTSGLGVTAHGIETGEIDLTAYHQRAETFISLEQSRPHVAPVNLDLLKKQIGLADDGAAPIDDERPSSLTLLAEAGEPVSLALPETMPGALNPISFQALTEKPVDPPHTVLATGPETVLLWLTSNYRFLLMTPRQVANMHAGGLTVSEVQRLEEQEVIGTVGAWGAIKRTPLLVICTSQGFARPFRMATMQGRIESPTALKLDRRLPGQPVAVLGLKPDQELVVISRRGRAARVSSDHLSVQGNQIMTRRKEDRIIQALPVEAAESTESTESTESSGQFLLLTAGGYARRIKVDWLPPSASKPKSVSLITRRQVCAIATVQPDVQLWAVTTTRLAPIEAEAVPLDTATAKKAYPVVKLAKGEKVTTILALPNPHVGEES